MPISISIYLISVLSLAGVVLRPWRSPEVLWAVAGAVVLVAFGLVPWREALKAVGEGNDVYLFLTGMMLLSALAEREGFFDTLAAMCVAEARGSSTRLFMLVYGVGTLVTVFMSNDATAVVLTPAVLAVCKKAGAKPLPYLLACALVANAASFVLPVSNPANLVVFADRMPPLLTWLGRFAVPSVLSIVVTWAVLRWKSRQDLAAPVGSGKDGLGRIPPLSPSGRIAAAGVALMAVVMLCASAFDVHLGLPALLASAVTCVAICIVKRESPLTVLMTLSWSILPLVAGLFIIVEGLRTAGLLDALTAILRESAQASSATTAMAAGTIVAFACNLMNNLPAGLIAGSVVSSAGVDHLVQSAILIGVDLGPNLSVTGSLATILWLVALRRQDEHVSAWTFLKTGAVAMPLALLAALAALWAQHAVLP